MKSTMEEDKVKDNIPEEDRQLIVSKCQVIIDWLDKNQMAEKDEFDNQQKEVERVCTPIIQKLYQAGGATGDGMPGGMPGGFCGKKRNYRDYRLARQ